MADEVDDEKFGRHRMAQNIERIRLFEIGGGEFREGRGHRVNGRVVRD